MNIERDACMMHACFGFGLVPRISLGLGHIKHNSTYMHADTILAHVLFIAPGFRLELYMYTYTPRTGLI